MGKLNMFFKDEEEGGVVPVGAVPLEADTFNEMVNQHNDTDDRIDNLTKISIGTEPNNSGLWVEKNERQLLSNIVNTQTKNGITLTSKGNGVYILNGTATAGTDFPLEKYNFISGKKYFLTGGYNTNAFLYIQDNGSDNGSGLSYNPTSNSSIFVGLYINSGITLSNVEIKPMLEYGTSSKGFEPIITPTIKVINNELYETLPLGKLEDITTQLKGTNVNIVKATKYKIGQLVNYQVVFVATSNISNLTDIISGFEKQANGYSGIVSFPIFNNNAANIIHGILSENSTLRLYGSISNGQSCRCNITYAVND